MYNYMELHKELIFGKGYSVFSIEKMDIFKKLRSSFVDRINISNVSNGSKVTNVPKNDSNPL